MDPTMEKVGRVLMNEDWETLFPLTSLRKISRFMSDHNPLLLCTEYEKNKENKNILL